VSAPDAVLRLWPELRLRLDARQSLDAAVHQIQDERQTQVVHRVRLIRRGQHSHRGWCVLDAWDVDRQGTDRELRQDRWKCVADNFLVHCQNCFQAHPRDDDRRSACRVEYPRPQPDFRCPERTRPA
jgi:hypothetical protein